MKIAIVGFDIEGQATYEYLTKLGGHQITICDQNPDIVVPAGAEQKLGADYLVGLDAYDVIVRTPGLHPRKILEKNPGVEVQLTSHLNLFFGACPTANIIGVTGTKGKGTTSSLIAKMLEADGKKVFLGGNIGVPPLTFADQLDESSWVVLELSSFQLIDARYSPHIAACLMVVPEHLNWHADYEEYTAAKAQLFAHQASDDLAVYFADSDTSKQVVSTSAGQKIPYFAAPGAYVEDGSIVIDGQSICQVDELQLLGKHNWQNACAAVTVLWQITQNVSALRSVLASFSGLEHRLEFVRELNGTKYYNDSFGTTPETAIVAIQAFLEPKVVVLGGSDKGADYTELAQAVATGNVRSVVLIGETAPKIRAALEAAGYDSITDGGTTMSEIMQAITSVAQSGYVVLLSTANASFDMFHDYKDRGEQFKSAVQSLGEAQQ
ncbi:MAG: UDP-N-acetylmuramoyl-L-alanine--D-glutamate ligase [Candidatus Saccharimonadales bacterium]